MAEKAIKAPKHEVMTEREVADYLRCSPRLVRKLVAVGELPSFKVGGLRRFRRSEIKRYVGGR